MTLDEFRKSLAATEPHTLAGKLWDAKGDCDAKIRGISP